MSSNTSRLLLTKLADSENFSNSVLNENWDKLEAEAVARNQGFLFGSSITLANFIDTCETKMGSKPGFYDIGFINYSTAVGIGLPTSGYIVGIVHDSSYKKIVWYSGNASDATSCMIGKVAGTWGATWAKSATFESGDWTPKLYDLDTYKRDLAAGKYYRIGNFIIAFQSQQNPDLSGISTMMQIRNIPMQVSLGGSMYIGALNGSGGLQTFQATDAKVYPRPNIKSSDLADASSPGYFNILIFGYSL